MQNKSLQVGEKLYGFRLEAVREIPEIEGTLYRFTHEKSGAELIWTKREDENKVFAITFRTTPSDDTGVFHILEHAVLCGSRKYPVKDPFVKLLQTSMQTFLNAMTYPDKTVFPVSSRNDKDFHNLMDVYLDAVFHPALLENPDIFYQEGWHYELEDGTDIPLPQGVVYSEMQGVFADMDAELETAVNRELYAGTCYSYVSGGLPEAIPTLTYEQFCETYRRYYVPCNAILQLDGALPIAEILEYIDKEYLGVLDTTVGAPAVIVPQTCFAPTVSTYRYGIAADTAADKQDCLVLARLAGNYTDLQQTIALNILCAYLCDSNESPLKRALLDAGLAQDVRLYLAEDYIQPELILEVRNTDATQFAAIRALIRSTLATVQAEGLDTAELQAQLNQIAFAVKDRPANYGLSIITRVLQSRLYGGEPELFLAYDAVLERLQQGLSNGYYEALLADMFRDETFYEIRLLAAPGLHTQRQDALYREMQVLHETLGTDGITGIARKAERLHAWQNTPDSAEAVAALPTLALTDVDPNPEADKGEKCVLGGVPGIQLRTLNSAVTYLRLYFAIPQTSGDKLFALSLLTNLLSNLPTAQYTVRELQREVNTHLGDLSFDLLTTDGDGSDTCRAYLVVSAAFLKDKLATALSLIREIALTTRFDDRQKIEEHIVQLRNLLKQSLVANGHKYGATRALSSLSAGDALKELTGGYACIEQMDRWANRFSTDADTLLAEMRALIADIFAANRLTIGISGEMAPDVLEKFVASLPAGDAFDPLLRVRFERAEAECIEIAGDVSYAVLAGNLRTQGLSYSATALVAAHLLSYDYLWNAIRVQNGAYGAGLQVRVDGDLLFYSYRDPNAANSLHVYREAGAYLKAFAQSGEPIDALKIGAICAIEPLLSAAQKTKMTCDGVLTGRDYHFRSKLKKEIFTVSHTDLEAFGDALQAVSARNNFCVVGNSAALAGLDVTVIRSV